MGTTFKIILYAKNETIAKAAAHRAFARIEALNKIMSDYLPTSELSQLSASAGSGRTVKLSKDLYRIIKKSQQWARRSDGVFDISIGPLSKLWRRAFRQQLLPPAEAIQQAQSLVNYRWIKCSWFFKKVRLKKKGMRLDLGGIAKGFAVDEAMKVLKKQGIKHALVEGGGDILVSKAPPNESGWEIVSVEHQTAFYLENQAIASSGARYQYLEVADKSYSHIIHPKTGYGVEKQNTVTVIAKTCTDADALASIASLMDQVRINKLKGSNRWEVYYF